MVSGHASGYESLESLRLVLGMLFPRIVAHGVVMSSPYPCLGQCKCSFQHCGPGTELVLCVSGFVQCSRECFDVCDG